MKLLLCVLCAVLVTGLLTGCADDDGGPTGPGPQVSSMSATIGGVSWSADILAAASRATDTPGLSLTGQGTYGTSSASVTIFIAQPSPGTFQMGGASNYDNFARVYPPGDTAGYSTIDSRATGTVRIASLTDDRVSGTFFFTAYKGDEPMVVTEGEFDLRIIVMDKGGGDCRGGSGVADVVVGEGGSVLPLEAGQIPRGSETARPGANPNGSGRVLGQFGYATLGGFYRSVPATPTLCGKGLQRTRG